jgi:sugar phosphate isomerase/epimerase
MKLTRRDLLMLTAAYGCGAASAQTTKIPFPRHTAGKSFRLAVCSETFQTTNFDQICRATLQTGYTGLEIAPFSLSEDPAAIPAQKRSEYRRTMASQGVACVGLHNLLTVPRGQLHITTPDEALRRRSWDYFRRLIDLCADVGDNGLMILGSGKQRGTTGGSSPADAVGRLQEGLAALAPHAKERAVTILVEPLAPHLCDVATTMEQAVAIVTAINQPSVQAMFDVHNTAGETLPADELIKRFAPYIRHVHINEMDGRHPGTGSYDFAVALRGLRDIAYDGWLSLEVFQFEPSGEEIARISAQYLRNLEQKLI